MVGRDIEDIWNWRERPIGSERLAVRGASGRKLPRPATFSIASGEIVGFFGLVGAGRSELFRLIYGADTRASGSVTLGDHPVPAAPKEAIRLGLVLCPEDRKADGIIQGRSVAENIVISTRR